MVQQVSVLRVRIEPGIPKLLVKINHQEADAFQAQNLGEVVLKKLATARGQIAVLHLSRSVPRSEVLMSAKLADLLDVEDDEEVEVASATNLTTTSKNMAKPAPAGTAAANAAAAAAAAAAVGVAAAAGMPTPPTQASGTAVPTMAPQPEARAPGAPSYVTSGNGRAGGLTFCRDRDRDQDADRHADRHRDRLSGNLPSKDLGFPGVRPEVLPHDLSSSPATDRASKIAAELRPTPQQPQAHAQAQPQPQQQNPQLGSVTADYLGFKRPSSFVSATQQQQQQQQQMPLGQARAGADWLRPPRSSAEQHLDQDVASDFGGLPTGTAFRLGAAGVGAEGPHQRSSFAGFMGQGHSQSESGTGLPGWDGQQTEQRPHELGSQARKDLFDKFQAAGSPCEKKPLAGDRFSNFLRPPPPLHSGPQSSGIHPPTAAAPAAAGAIHGSSSNIGAASLGEHLKAPPPLHPRRAGFERSSFGATDFNQAPTESGKAGNSDYESRRFNTDLESRIRDAREMGRASMEARIGSSSGHLHHEESKENCLKRNVGERRFSQLDGSTFGNGLSQQQQKSPLLASRPTKPGDPPVKNSAGTFHDRDDRNDHHQHQERPSLAEEIRADMAAARSRRSSFDFLRDVGLDGKTSSHIGGGGGGGGSTSGGVHEWKSSLLASKLGSVGTGSSFGQNANNDRHLPQAPPHPESWRRSLEEKFAEARAYAPSGSTSRRQPTTDPFCCEGSTDGASTETATPADFFDSKASKVGESRHNSDAARHGGQEGRYGFAAQSKFGLRNFPPPQRVSESADSAQSSRRTSDFSAFDLRPPPFSEKGAGAPPVREPFAPAEAPSVPPCNLNLGSRIGSSETADLLGVDSLPTSEASSSDEIHADVINALTSARRWVQEAHQLAGSPDQKKQQQNHKDLRSFGMPTASIEKETLLGAMADINASRCKQSPFRDSCLHKQVGTEAAESLDPSPAASRSRSRSPSLLPGSSEASSEDYSSRFADLDGWETVPPATRTMTGTTTATNGSCECDEMSAGAKHSFQHRQQPQQMQPPSASSRKQVDSAPESGRTSSSQSTSHTPRVCSASTSTNSENEGQQQHQATAARATTPMAAEAKAPTSKTATATATATAARASARSTSAAATVGGARGKSAAESAKLGRGAVDHRAGAGLHRGPQTDSTTASAKERPAAPAPMPPPAPTQPRAPTSTSTAIVPLAVGGQARARPRAASDSAAHVEVGHDGNHGGHRNSRTLRRGKTFTFGALAPEPSQPMLTEPRETVPQHFCSPLDADGGGLERSELGLEATVEVKRWLHGEISGPQCSQVILDRALTVLSNFKLSSGCHLEVLGGPLGAIVGGYSDADWLLEEVFSKCPGDAIREAFTHMGFRERGRGDWSHVSADEISLAYRRMCLRGHPSRGGSPRNYLKLQVSMELVRAFSSTGSSGNLEQRCGGPAAFEVQSFNSHDDGLVLSDAVLARELKMSAAEAEKEASNLSREELEELNRAVDEYILRQMCFKSEIVDEIARLHEDSAYAILGVSASATDSEIKKAYRLIAMQCHPDKGGDKEEFQELHDAYEKIMEQRRSSNGESVKKDFEEPPEEPPKKKDGKKSKEKDGKKESDEDNDDDEEDGEGTREEGAKSDGSGNAKEGSGDADGDSDNSLMQKAGKSAEEASRYAKTAAEFAHQAAEAAEAARKQREEGNNSSSDSSKTKSTAHSAIVYTLTVVKAVRAVGYATLDVAAQCRAASQKRPQAASTCSEKAVSAMSLGLEALNAALSCAEVTEATAAELQQPSDGKDPSKGSPADRFVAAAVKASLAAASASNAAMAAAIAAVEGSRQCMKVLESNKKKKDKEEGAESEEGDGSGSQEGGKKRRRKKHENAAGDHGQEGDQDEDDDGDDDGEDQEDFGDGIGGDDCGASDRTAAPKRRPSAEEAALAAKKRSVAQRASNHKVLQRLNAEILSHQTNVRQVLLSNRNLIPKVSSESKQKIFRLLDDYAQEARSEIEGASAAALLSPSSDGGAASLLATLKELPLIYPFIQEQSLAIPVSVKSRVLKMAALYDLPSTLKILEAHIFETALNVLCGEGSQYAAFHEKVKVLRRKVTEELANNVAEASDSTA